MNEFKTSGGVYKSDDGPNVYTAPVAMWLKAFDLCLDKLRIEGVDFSEILAISGCAQQHGSVWWRRDSGELLSQMDPDKYLHECLSAAFSLKNSPIWMDASTTEECKFIESYVGGPEEMAEITGSRAYERFTGPQISKIYRKRPEVYETTERITLISNFIASIFLGSYAPFDASDSSGMNMMDLKENKWSNKCLEAILNGNTEDVANLRSKLGCSENDDNIVESHKILGHVSEYFINRYGFSNECLVSSFTGDNPGSFAGLCLAENEILISLGTSDTTCFTINQPHPRLNGHILRNPLDTTRYMGLICHKNGSLTRERIRNDCASGDWNKFSELLNSVPRGNFGNIAFYFDMKEIYPLVQGDFRFNSRDQRIQSLQPELEVRACVEGQFMRLYNNSEQLGFEPSKANRILVTGGASINKAIIQVLADVFKLPVFSIETSNSAALGAAYLAKYAYANYNLSTDDMLDFDKAIMNLANSKRDLVKITDPTDIASFDVYKSIYGRVKRLEESIVANNQ